MDPWLDTAGAAAHGPSSLSNTVAAATPSTAALFNEQILHQRLQELIEGAQGSWTYAIFWQSSVDIATGVPFLRWGGGHISSGGDNRNLRRADASDDAEQRRRKEVFRALSGVDAAVDLEEVTDSEWFFFECMEQTFLNGDGNPGRVLANRAWLWVTGDELQVAAPPCDHTWRGHELGIRTMVFVPIGNDVLELGSTNIIPINLTTMATFLLSFNAVGPPPQSTVMAEMQTDHGKADDPSSLRILDPSTVDPRFLLANTENPNPTTLITGELNLSELGSKSSAAPSQSLPTADLSNVEPEKAPKKRGRRSAGKELVSHLEAERQRREKINQRFSALREIVPNVSDKADRVTALDGAISYITELKKKNEELRKKRQCHGAEIDVKILASEASILVRCEKRNHPAASLMVALRELELEVVNASVSVVDDAMIQKVKVKMSTKVYQREDELAATLSSMLAEPIMSN